MISIQELESPTKCKVCRSPAKKVLVFPTGKQTSTHIRLCDFCFEELKKVVQGVK